jgi:hypothetical protein
MAQPAVDQAYLAKPPGDCCIARNLHQGEPRGTQETIAGIDTYVVHPPKAKTSNGNIILYFPDVWGLFKKVIRYPRVGLHGLIPVPQEGSTNPFVQIPCPLSRVLLPTAVSFLSLLSVLSLVPLPLSCLLVPITPVTCSVMTQCPRYGKEVTLGRSKDI